MKPRLTIKKNLKLEAFTCAEEAQKHYIKNSTTDNFGNGPLAETADEFLIHVFS